MDTKGRLLQKELNGYAVYWNQRRIGEVQLYDNPYHKRNCYVTLTMERLDAELSAELFSELRQIAARPLQAMVHSEDTALTAFLLAGGFVCRRKCYEVEASIGDYMGGRARARLMHSCRGESDYMESCRMMFDYYVQTHQAVNPWTAGYDLFCEDMPEDVICTKQDGKIVSLAFIEGNEIAYLCGADKQYFSDFAHGLVEMMFSKHNTICFESDDCDWAAMVLKSLFRNRDKGSFDTYIMES